MYKTIKLEPREEYKYFSHSRLERYMQCPTLYRLQYIEKSLPRVEAEHFILGTLCHRSFEIFHTQQKPIDIALQAAVDEFLGDLQLGPKSTQTEAAQKFVDLVDAYNRLYYLASSACTEAGAIRTRDGLIAARPDMTSAWKKEAKKLKIPDKAKDIQKYLSSNYPNYVDLDIPRVIAEAGQLTAGYKLPSWFSGIDPRHIEVPISEFDRHSREVTNPVRLTPDTFFLGYIDFIAISNKGSVIIGDHKTSKKQPTQETVEATPQLNRYCWAYRELYGTLPDFICIHHVRSGEWITSKVNPEYVEREHQNMLRMAEGINNEVFPYHSPAEYNSPCENCDALHLCWPKVALYGMS